jgi:ornithine--oxo-acid transaminase
MSSELGELLAARSREALDLHAEYVNPQMIRVLRTIGFDKDWARTEGACLHDGEGNRYLDWLGSFGMFNVGRNNRARARLAHRGAGAQTPNAPQLSVSPVTPLLAAELVRRRRRRFPIRFQPRSWALFFPQARRRHPRCHARQTRTSCRRRSERRY